MRRIISVLLLLLVKAGDAMPKLGDVFQVDTRDPSVYFSSCLQRSKADDPSSTYFDPDAAADDVSHIINKSWKHANTLNSFILDQTTSDKYDADKEVKKLMTAFFGIIGNAVPGPGQNSLPVGTYRQKYDDVRSGTHQLRASSRAFADRYFRAISRCPRFDRKDSA